MKRRPFFRRGAYLIIWRAGKAPQPAENHQRPAGIIGPGGEATHQGARLDSLSRRGKIYLCVNRRWHSRGAPQPERGIPPHPLHTSCEILLHGSVFAFKSSCV